MRTVIGIDVGGSTTKIVGFPDERMTSPLFVKANDPLASVYGALGKFVAENGVALSEIEKILVTGVGQAFLTAPLYAVPTAKVNEFTAIGLGGLYLTGLSEAIIVSMGTGTAFVDADADGARHLGGTGVGGGLLIGLAGRMLQLHDFDTIVETAKGGDLDKVDLFIKDITKGSVNNLTPSATAANFGKVSDLATKEDIALGIINMVFQTIGMMAAFNARGLGKDVVLTGSLTKIPQAREIFDGLSDVTGVRFLIPEHAEFATAAGAALVHRKGRACEDI